MLGQAVAAIAVALLGASGIAKLADPDPTTGAMQAAGLPSSTVVSRLLGLAEIVVAAGALVAGGPWLLAGAGLYAGFALFALYAVRRELPIQSCGCFGRDDTPPTTTHVAFNAAAAIALVSSALLEMPIVPWTVPLEELLLYLAFTILGAMASYLMLSRLAQLKALSPQ